MSESLVIRLGMRESDPVAWIVTDDTGAVLTDAATGNLTAAAAAAAPGRRVILLVPAFDVLRTTAEVPVRGATRVLQALPFALEEQLADDVEELHFAAAQRLVDGALGAAVVHRHRMDRWRDRLANADLAVDCIYSEADAVGGVPNTSTLLLEEHAAVLAHPDGSSSAVEPDGLELLLDLWIAADMHGEDAMPRHLIVLAPPELAGRFASLWDRLRPGLASLEVRSLGTEGALPRLAAQITTSPGVNLLQGSYARRSSLAGVWPAWRVAAVLLLAFSLLFLAAQGLELARLRRESAALDRSMEQAFNYTFPGSGPLKDPQTQIAARLRATGTPGGSEGSREFLDALGAVAKAMVVAKGVRVEGMSYRTGAMELRVRAPSVEALDRIQKVIAQNPGLKAEIQAANAEGNEVRGRLQIKRAGS